MKSMNRQSLNSLLRFGVIGCVSAGIIFGTGAGSWAQSIPDSATPGAVQPSFEIKSIPTRKTPKITIPPVVDRPLNIEEGPKIIVQDFTLDGANDYPDLGVSVGGIKTLIAEALNEYPDGVTVGQLQLISNKVSKYYREKGFILAHAFIAEQTVEQGVVNISVLEGILGAITVEGNEKFSERLIKRPFDDLLGKPLVKDSVEGALLTLMDYPGLAVTGMFTPGEQVGTAEMVIKVEEEKPFKGGVSLNNYGSEYVGEYQLRGDFTLNNITRAADELSISLMQSYDPQLMVYGSLSYKRPLSKKYKLGVGASRNAFDVGRELKNTDLEGISRFGNIYIDRSFVKSRKNNLGSRFEMSLKDSETRVPSETRGRDKLSVFSASLFGDCIHRFAGGAIELISLKYSKGVGGFLGSMSAHNDSGSARQGGSGLYAGASFDKLELNYSHLQRLGENSSALFRLQTQWSDDLLASIEQFPLGGPESVRAYAQSEYMRDRGYFTSLEFFFNAPGFAEKPAFFNQTWGEMLQFSVFFDMAGGHQNDPLPSEEKRAYLSGAGVGCRFVVSDRFLASLTVAKKLGTHEPADGRSPHTYFKLGYQF